MNRPAYTVEDVVKLLGVTPRTLHYYEEVGLLEPAARTQGGHRLYGEDTLERLHHILRLKDALGYSLQEIKSILDTEYALDKLKAKYKNNQSSENRDSILEESILEESIRLLEEVLQRVDDKLSRLQTVQKNIRDRLEKIQALRDRTTTTKSHS